MFRKELDAELLKLKGGTRKGYHLWPSEKLLKLVVEIAVTSSSRKGKDPRWPVVTATLVSIYRDETAKKRAIDNFNLNPPDAGDSGTKKGSLRPRGLEDATTEEYS